ncbi:hypothetical protein FQN57_007411 [Myotisia sp. PD_48]|nr:hypothetical protein FQN57_007411 [Myotisia sp. PD_48]
MSSESSPTSPVPREQLTTIATQVCDTVFDGVTQYDHDKVAEWNSRVINTVLKSLIDAVTPSGETDNKVDSAIDASKPTYRFSVTSTLIQQDFSNKDDSTPPLGRRGMHCASGAFWDSQHDGMWTYKYNGEDKGLELVLNIAWFKSFT